MNLFDKYYEEYKKLPFECKAITNWLERVGDDIQHERIPELTSGQLYKLSIAMRHANAKCRECDCPQKSS